MLPAVECDAVLEKSKIDTNGFEVAERNPSLPLVPATPPSIELLEFSIAAGRCQLFEPRGAAVSRPREIGQVVTAPVFALGAVLRQRAEVEAFQQKV